MEGVLAEDVERRRRSGRGRWKSIKILRQTDMMIEKYSKALGMTKYEFIDFVVTIFGILLRERVKISRDEARTLGLVECEAEHDAEYSYLYPSCIAYKFAAFYFRKKYLYETLLENLKRMYEREKEKEAEENEESREG